MKTYTIRTGASFKTTGPDGRPLVKHGGETIELEDDVAAAHADKLDPGPEAGEGEPPAAEG